MLLSACLITRDETAALPACLASLAGFVDEIVVYDTGSTDDTVELARAAGARVLTGYWDDDFARARNAALAACNGEWILHVDADEIARGDAGALRGLLGRTGAAALLVDIDNVLDNGLGSSYRHRACRLFRRSRGEWRGRIHEQVVERGGTEALPVTADAGAFHIEHTGYRTEAMSAAKVERNLRLVQAALDESADGLERGFLLLDFGRCLLSAGRHDDAVVRFAEVAGAAPGSPPARQAARFAASALLALGRLDAAKERVAAYRALSRLPAVADLMEGQILLLGADPEAALQRFGRIGELVDDDGFRPPVGLLHLQRGLALSLLGHWHDASDALATAIADHGAVQGNLGLLVHAALAAGRDTAWLAGVLARVGLAPALAEVTGLTPDQADACCEALWSNDHDDARILGCATRAATELDLQRAAVWAGRLLAAGLPDSPLLAQAADRARPVEARVHAGAAAVALGDERGLEAIAAAAEHAQPGQYGDLLVAVNELAPEALPALITGAVAQPRRSLDMASCLHGLDATDEAVSVLAFGLERGLPARDVLGWLRASGLGELAPALGLQPLR